MRYEQKTTLQSLARERELETRLLSPSPPPLDHDELSFLDDRVDKVPTLSHNQHTDHGHMPIKTQFLSELVGTYILVLIGGGATWVSLYGDVDDNAIAMPTKNWTARAVMWTLGALLGIYNSASISGGHLNPAITLAFWLVRPTAFSPAKVLPYIVAQVLGAFLAAVTLILLFHQAMIQLEARHLGSMPQTCQVTTESGVLLFLYGAKGHIKACQQYDLTQLRTLSAFAGFWSQNDYAVANSLHATFVEAFGTAFVVFVIFSVTSSSYPIPGPAVPPVVAVALGCMIYLLIPLTGDHLNPANEIGRRLAGTVWLAMQRHQGLALVELQSLVAVLWLDVVPYIVGPMIGGPLGAWIADAVQPAY